MVSTASRTACLNPNAVLLPSGVGSLMVPGYQLAPHILEMEGFIARMLRGDFRKGVVSIPIRHGKTQYTNAIMGCLLVSDPTLRILRVMENATVCESQALQVLKFIRDYGPRLTGVQIEKQRSGLADFQTTAGGGLKSLGMLGTAESLTFDWIIMDDCLVDPAAIRNPFRREQAYHDLRAKFMSRVNPTGYTKFLYIGSRRHPADPQGQLFATNAGISNPRERWYYHHSAALIDEGTDHERPLWPGSTEFGTVEQLHAKRDELTEDGVAWQWNCFFQNDAVSAPDNLAFDPAWFNEQEMFYDEMDPAVEINNRVISFDPSMGEGTAENDFFAIAYQLFTPNGTRYVDDMWCQQAKPDTAIAAAVDFVERHQDHDVVAFEANAGGRYVEKCIRDECERRQLRFNTVFKTWVSGKDNGLDMGDKVGRISLALWEPLSKRKVKIKRGPHGRILYKQLRGFPTEHDDAPDALATGDIVLRELLRARFKR